LRLLEGGTIVNATVINPSVTGGTFAAPALSNPAIDGSVTVDAQAAGDLANAVAPHLPAPALDRAAVAAVFKDATNALPLIPDTAVVTKEDLEAENALLRAEMAALKLTAAEIAGVFNNRDGNPLSPGTVLLSRSEVRNLVETAKAEAVAAIPDADAIAGVFTNKDGNALSPGTQLLSMADTIDQIKLAICDGCGGGGGTISSLQWDAASRTLTVTTDDGSGTTETKTITLTGLVTAGDTYAGNMVQTSVTKLPLKIIGGITKVLGTPGAWLRVSVGGTQGVIPWFAV
jgi:hypothetical protein